MANTCVMCNSPIELPEGTQVCFACSHAKENCPDCGSALRFMSSCSCHTGSAVLHSKLYHCETCHADWETENPTVETTKHLKRKFWG
jgi:hypothetical protein